MNQIYKNNTLGTYSPFFHIHLNTEKSLDDLANLSNDEFGVFIHEYIHFLQDVLTIYGLRNILHVLDTTLVIIREIKKNKKSPIQLPIENLEDQIINTNLTLVQNYFGDSTFRTPFDTLDNYEIRELVYTNPTNNNDQKDYFVYLNVSHSLNFLSKSKSFHFGVISIIESMADLIESSIIGETTSPFVPYKVVDFLANQMLPNASWTKPMLVALCETSLQSLNPPFKMIDMLEKMKFVHYSPTCVDDILSFHEGYTFGDKETSQVLEMHQNDVKSYLLHFFYHEILSSATGWIDNVISTCKQLTRSKFFISKTLEDNSAQDFVQYLVSNVIDKLGFPLLSNAKNKYWGDNGTQIIFKAVLETIKILTEDSYSRCDLYNHCSSGTKDITCKHCLKDPWKRANGGTDCPLTKLWKMWGIDQLKFVK